MSDPSPEVAAAAGADVLAFLERWYADQCNGHWERRFGVHLETLENPGWRVSVDLVGTPLEHVVLEPQVIERSEHDWVTVRSDGHRFEVACGPGNLVEALGQLRSFVLGPPATLRSPHAIDEPPPVDARRFGAPIRYIGPPGMELASLAEWFMAGAEDSVHAAATMERVLRERFVEDDRPSELVGRLLELLVAYRSADVHGEPSSDVPLPRAAVARELRQWLRDGVPRILEEEHGPQR